MPYNIHDGVNKTGGNGGGGKASSTDMQRIFDDARKFSAQYAGFVKAAEIIGSLGSIEQAIADSQQRLKIHRDAEEKAVQDAKAADAARAIDHNAEMKRLETELEAKRKEAERVGSAARAEERSIIDNAKMAAEKIKADADQNIARAYRDELAKLQDAGKQVQAHRDELVKLQTEIADHEIEFAELDKQVQQKRAKLKEVVEEHARFLEKIGVRS